MILFVGLMRQNFFLFFLVLCFSAPSQAKLFKNSYISFEIPDTWECKAFGTDWVCHSKFQEKKVEALITSTAKLAGGSDTLEAYLAHLQQPKTWTNRKKETLTSKKIVEAKRVFINKFPWIDSTHQNSEIKSYISRYAGTVCCKDSSSQLGMLVVLSAHQDHYTKYANIFLKVVSSLRVMDIEKAISKVRAFQAEGAESGMSSYLEGLFDDSGTDMEGEESAQIFGMDAKTVGALALIAFTVLVYIILKRKIAGGRRRRRRSHRRKR